MHWFDAHWGGGFMMILWWALIIIGIVLLVKWISDQKSRTNEKGDSALEVLKRRYANGEISKEEFEEKSRI